MALLAWVEPLASDCLTEVDVYFKLVAKSCLTHVHHVVFVHVLFLIHAVLNSN
jgi:hypothetical protein